MYSGSIFALGAKGRGFKSRSSEVFILVTALSGVYIFNKKRKKILYISINRFRETILQQAQHKNLFFGCPFFGFLFFFKTKEFISSARIQDSTIKHIVWISTRDKLFYSRLLPEFQKKEKITNLQFLITARIEKQPELTKIYKAGLPLNTIKS